MTTKTQYVCNVADSHRNKSNDHSESLAFPIKESQDGPPDPASGWKCVARIWRTTSLSMSTPNAKAICSAIRLQPQLQLRRFISRTARSVLSSGLWDLADGLVWGKTALGTFAGSTFMKVQQSRGF